MTPARRKSSLKSSIWLLALAWSLAETASADPPEDTRRGDVTSYRFEDDLVEGGTRRPDVEVLHVRTRQDRDSLVRVRTHFIPELLKAAELL